VETEDRALKGKEVCRGQKIYNHKWLNLEERVYLLKDVSEVVPEVFSGSDSKFRKRKLLVFWPD
jgi:hypothetical protein